jgi:hypothetical protein
VEELHVYPVFQQSEITRDSARQAQEDHRAIKVLLEALHAMPSGFQWVTKFNELYEAATPPTDGLSLLGDLLLLLACPRCLPI